jgi:hypothetical protein
MNSIKDLPRGNARTKLLKFIQEPSTKDNEDKAMANLSPYLAALENASEIARLLFQPVNGDPVFERISDAISLECKCVVPVVPVCIDIKGLRRHKVQGRHFLHLGLQAGEGGHYSGAIVNNKNKTVYLSDSMGLKGGLSKTFISTIRSAYPGYKLVVESLNVGPQPTGGFTSNTLDNFTKSLRNENITPPNTPTLKQWHEIHMMDELSQHHFCYIEAFVYLCHRLLGSPIGLTDPSNRIKYIKRVCMALIKKFNLFQGVDKHVIDYFNRTFPYYLKVTNLNNTKLELKSGFHQIPKNTVKEPDNKIYKQHLVPIDMSFLRYITTETTMKELMYRALSS